MKRKKKRKRKSNPQATKMKKLARKWNKLSDKSKRKYHGKFSEYVKTMY